MNHSKWLRNNLDKAIQLFLLQGYVFPKDEYVSLEQKRQDLQKLVENLQQERNQKSKQVGMLKKDGQDASIILKELNQVSQDLKTNAEELKKVQDAIFSIEAQLPNLAHESVPKGLSENENVAIKNVYTVKDKDFDVLDHVSLGENRGIDFATASSMSGSRFVVYSAKIAKLHRVLANWMLDTHINEHGYVEHNTPLLVSKDALFGSGQLPKFSDDLFLCNDVNMGLIPTAEVSLVNCFNNKIFQPKELPLKYVAHTPCFRREAGSYGKDTRGLIRTHQFEKVELVQAVMPQDSYDALEDILKHSQVILQRLDLPYRIVELCKGDLGFCAAKTYDLEVWIESQKNYREIASISNCEAFQARRMQSRVKTDEGIEYIHTLNGSGLAVSRTLVAILEYYQNKDGSITMPEILRPLLGFDKI